ncbi:MAG: dual specificity protein phosphatase family protein, partial [Planctomycetota bacterium]
VLKVRNWWDEIHPHVILGARPFPSDVPRMAQHGVAAVVNTCGEYDGPVDQYQIHDIDQLHIPTVDFTHPSYESVCEGVEFVQQHVSRGHTVYIHCKAGRARSATIAICWLMKHQNMSPDSAQRLLLQKRPHVNPRLTLRPVVQRFAREQCHATAE